jgi:hypothetical protein
MTFEFNDTAQLVDKRGIQSVYIFSTGKKPR